MRDCQLPLRQPPNICQRLRRRGLARVSRLTPVLDAPWISAVESGSESHQKRTQDLSEARGRTTSTKTGTGREWRKSFRTLVGRGTE